MKNIVLISLLMALPACVVAKAYIPDNENQVLIEVEQSERIQQLKSLRLQLQRQPDNPALLSKILARYIQIGRELSDERYFSYAESLLKTYLQHAQINAQIKVQWADILQRQHQFTGALELLNQVIKLDPRHAQARLMRSIIYQSKGDYQHAMQDCKALLRHVDLLVSTTCITQIDALQGRLSRSIPLLQQTIRRYSNADSETLHWSRTVLAEMYLRNGQRQQATEQLDAVLADTTDYYALAVKADILLQQARYQDVENLLRPHKRISKLLLRYVIATKHLGTSSSRDHDALTTAIQRARLFDSTGAHKRMLARYYLDINDNPTLAVSMAKANWEQQREPDDALLLMRSLLAARDYLAMQSLQQTLSQKGLVDSRIEALTPGRAL